VMILVTGDRRRGNARSSRGLKIGPRVSVHFPVRGSWLTRVVCADKENDVVARAKLDAKKKFGSNPSTQAILLSNGQVEKPSPSHEKESYIRRRIRDDFTRLMNRQTKVFADDIAKLEPFQIGFSQKCFPATAFASGSDANLASAGTLLVNILPALAEKEVSRTSQLAADALIHALETGSSSPESFFDAIASLAENKEILVGSDRILAQLFSRSSSSGNTKVLRTSSGADSKLFATTNGPFIIYNTIENTETKTSPSSRYPNRSFAIPNSASGRASPRERKPTPKMLSVSEVSTRPQRRTSTSPRTSPPKVLKLTRPSKLRGSVSLARSPSPPRKRVKLTDEHVPAAHDPTESDSVSQPQLARAKHSLNEYQSEEAAHPRAAPSRAALGGKPCPQIEIKDDLVKNLLDWALFASQEDTDDCSGVDDQGTIVPNGATGVDSAISVQPSPGKQNDEPNSRNLRTCSKPAARGYDHTFPAASALAPEEIAEFNRIIGQLPETEANLNREKVENVAALYDQIAQGPSFERAKELGFSYPEIPRPFADKDGWKLTGVINHFGEEIVEIDRQSWIYPTERTGETQQPLRRLKRKVQLERDHVFGFPPPAGYGNEPQHKRPRLDEEDEESFAFEENIAYQKLMVNIRKAAEVRGLPCDNALTWEELADSIKNFDASRGVTFNEAVTSPVNENIDDDADDGISSHVEASELSALDSDDDSDYEPETAVKQDIEEVWAGRNGAQISTFVAVNGRRGSLRNLRDRSSSSSYSAQGVQNRAMDLSTVLDVSEVPPALLQRLTSNQPNHAEMSPPASITRYDIRPPTTSGTYNTFNGPITSSNTPTASPAGTPTFMKLNFNLRRKRSSASPAPSTTTATRRPSTASIISTSSLASRPPSAQPLNIDNTNAYNAAKGYTTNSPTPNSNSNSNGSADPGSPYGLNGGFPGGGIIINAPDKRGDGRGQRRKSKAPDFKMTVQKAGKEGPKVQARAVRGGTVLKFT